MQRLHFLFVLSAGLAITLAGCAKQLAQPPAPGPNANTEQPAPVEPAAAVEPAAPENAAEVPAAPSGEVAEVTITASQGQFLPSTIVLQQNQPARLIFDNVDFPYLVVQPDLGLNVQLTPGQRTTAELNPSQKGGFSFFCSGFCGSGTGQMRGTIKVE